MKNVSLRRHGEFSESIISINGYFDTGSEALACLHQMMFINFEHSSSYGGLEIFYGVMGFLTVLSQNYSHM